MYFDQGLSEHIRLRQDTEAGSFGRRHSAINALRRTVGGADGDVAVEVGGAEKKLCGRAVGEMGDGGGGNVAAPGIKGMGRFLARTRTCHLFSEKR